MPTLLAPPVASPLPGTTSPKPTRHATTTTHKLALTGRQLEHLTRNLETQLDAGVAIVRALQVHIEHADSPKMAEVCRGLLGQISAGAALSEALESYPRAFPPIYRSLVRSGEQSGHLPQILGQLADFMAWRDDVRRTVTRAAIYPSLVLLATFALFLFLIGFVLPRFEEMFTRLGDQIPTATALLLWLGKGLAAHWVALSLGAAGATLVAALAMRSPAVRDHAYQVFMRVPGLGTALHAIDLARMTRTLAVLSGAGVPLIRGLELTQDAIADRRLRRRVREMTAAVVRGQTFSQAAASTAALPPLALNLVGIGEETGRMPAVLDRLARAFDRSARERVAQALAMLEPAFTVVLGVLVGGLALMVITTLYKTMTVGR